ncbi:testis-specific serine/threonine-protein kinase 1-like [Lineus longissimus]|uniref:testis-specific serine/threonine-protein kinase 1-like n=1 Tax=Lineus longissimus TaxID=88925 RepID=UPI00315C5903
MADGGTIHGGAKPGTSNGKMPDASKKTAGAVSPGSFLGTFGYKLGRTVGEGSYAKVKVAEVMAADGGHVAVKIINRRKAPKDFIQKFLPRELYVVNLLHHPNIVQVFNILDHSDIVFIVMEYAHSGDLLDYIKSHGALPESQARRMFLELCSAIRYCHQLNIVHRDLKCENLLLDKTLHIKVSDFGFSRQCVDATGKRILSKTFCGSAAYAAPEVLQGTPYNPKMYDVWSMGCILYIMVCGSMPYDDTNVKKMLKTQLEHKVGFPSRVIDKLSMEVKLLLHHILEVDITRRATLDQVLRDTWSQKKELQK